MTMELQMLLLFGSLGVVMTGVGWAAWTGRYRAWARLGRGYRVLAMLPAGIGFLLLGTAAVLPVRIGGVLFLLGGLCCFFGFLYVLATLFVKDRWYPRWYHRLPPDQREW
ncbi:MAG: hypothetical protein ACRDYA_11875 [Egibacteraceae bacterium]